MSLTARERDNPPPRRKSCAACIKAKRRCDFAVPACLRCSQRRIACEYPGRSVRHRLAAPSPGPAMRFALGVDDALSAAAAAAAAAAAPPVQFDGMDGMDGMGAMDQVAACGDAGLPDLSLMDFPVDGMLMDMEMIHQPSALAPPTAKEFQAVAEAVTKRLRFAIEEIKQIPCIMIMETQTPWCHPLLYKEGMPRSMQDAHAACALYMAKNRVNAPVIFHAIEVRVCDLLASPPPTTFVEILARTQALILYQTIRLFDGDIAARASAERSIPDLEASTMDLLSHVRFDVDSSADLPLYPLAPTKAFWRDWIVHESARRTVLFSFFFLQSYRLLSGQRGLTCDGRLGLCHAWTLSAHLWCARSPVEFARAWRGEKHFVVTDAQFGPVLEEARAEDVDRFGRMWISCLLGVEEAEGWFASRGGSLRVSSE